MAKVNKYVLIWLIINLFSPGFHPTLPGCRPYGAEKIASLSQGIVIFGF